MGQESKDRIALKAEIAEEESLAQQLDLEIAEKIAKKDQLTYVTSRLRRILTRMTQPANTELVSALPAKSTRRKKAETAETMEGEPVLGGVNMDGFCLPAKSPNPPIWRCSRGHEFNNTAIVMREKGGTQLSCCPVCEKPNPNIQEIKG
jgi:hypothetical protein